MEIARTAPAIFLVDIESGELVHVSGYAQTLFGKSESEFRRDWPEFIASLQVGPDGLGSDQSSQRELTYGGQVRQVAVTLEPIEVDGRSLHLVLVRDLSQPLKMERKSRILSAALEAAEDLIALIDPDDLTILEINRGGLTSLGYSQAEMEGRKPTDFMAQLSLEQYRRRYVEPIMQGERSSVQFEARHRRSDGTEFPVEVLLQMVEADTSERVLLQVCRDVSEGHQTRRELDRFFAMSLEMLCIASADGYFLRLNPYFSNVLGYTEEELMRKPFLHFVHPEDVEKTQSVVQELLVGHQTVGFENRYLKADGTYCHLVWTSLYDPDTARVYGAARDITEVKEREKELADQYQRLEEAVSLDRAARRTLMAFDQIKSVDESLKAVLKVISEDLNIRPLAFYLLDDWSAQLQLSASISLPPGRIETYELGVGMVGEAASSQEPVFLEVNSDDPEGRVLTLETGIGTIHPRSVFAFPMIHQERTLGVLTGASQSLLSEREKSALEQLASLTSVGLHAMIQFRQLQQLSHQLTERGRRISIQNQELIKASRLKSEFLANMSHELRTPLNAIIGFSECLRDGLLGPLDDGQADYVTEIFNSGQHLLSLINDILDLSKIEAGMMTLELQETDFYQIVASSLHVVKEQAFQKGLEIKFDGSPQLEPIFVDPRRVRQIIYNLLSNAVKFTDTGGRVKVELKRVQDDLLLSVEDNGIGIAPEDQQRLFEPFVQLDSDLSRKYEGTGLGLGLVKRLVELHGGSIQLWSEVGKGSRFTVALPYRQKEERSLPMEGEDAAAQGTHNQPAGLGSPSLLLVSDDAVIQQSLQELLLPVGYELFCVSKPSEALRAMRARTLDLVFLDALPNSEKTRRFLQSLHEDALHENVPVVILGQDNVERDIENGLRVIESLQKPVTSRRLFETLSKVGIGRGNSGPPRVLVVDDDPRAVDYVARILESKDCPVYRAYGGQDALSILDREEVDLMVLDLLMPGIAGFEVLREMRRSPLNADIPVVVLTAKTLTPSEREILSGTVASVLEKADCDDVDVVSAIRRGLTRSRRREVKASWDG